MMSWFWHILDEHEIENESLHFHLNKVSTFPGKITFHPLKHTSQRTQFHCLGLWPRLSTVHLACLSTDLLENKVAVTWLQFGLVYRSMLSLGLFVSDKINTIKLLFKIKLINWFHFNIGILEPPYRGVTNTEVSQVSRGFREHVKSEPIYSGHILDQCLENWDTAVSSWRHVVYKIEAMFLTFIRCLFFMYFRSYPIYSMMSRCIIMSKGHMHIA